MLTICSSSSGAVEIRFITKNVSSTQPVILCGRRAEFSVLVEDTNPEITLKGRGWSNNRQGFMAHYKQVNGTLRAISGKSRNVNLNVWYQLRSPECSWKP